MWLEVQRLSRKEPPSPPKELSEWVLLSADLARPPEIRIERIVTVSAAERDVALSKGEVPFKNSTRRESINDLTRAFFQVATDGEGTFRCVTPIIRFSMQFYPETMLPLRIPSAQERLDPPLIDIYVPHGARGRGKKVNSAEADVIVEEIERLTRNPEYARSHTIGVIRSLERSRLTHPLTII